MKKIHLCIVLNFSVLIAYSQSADSLNTKKDTSFFNTPNPFLTRKNNYESINNSFITGSAFPFIRSQDSPLMTIDGIPVNPYFSSGTSYRESLGSQHLLSYDISNVKTATLYEEENRIISGNYTNAVLLNTKDIDLEDTKHYFEVNNFSSVHFQNLDKLGYSTITNFNGQKSFEKIGFRYSLSIIGQLG